MNQNKSPFLLKQLLTYCVVVAIPSALFAQLTPPAQPYVLRYTENTIARAPLLSELDPASPFTMEAWVFPESTQAFAVIVGKPHTNRSSDPFMRFVIGVSPNGQYEVVHSTGAPGTYRAATSTQPIVLKRWTHLAAVLSGTTMFLYIDGELAASGSTAGASTSSATVPFGVGAGVTPDGMIAAGGIVGALRQVRVWNKALTREEIRTSAQSASPGPLAGLAAAWPLDEGVGTSAAASNRTDAALTLGTAEGWGKPEWIRTGVLDSLDLFYNTISTVAITTQPNSFTQDLIPFDIDLDGDLDLIIPTLVYPPTYPGTEAPVVVLRNNGSGQFTQVTDSWVNDLRFVHPRHWSSFDANKDGKQELVIVDHGTDIPPFGGGFSQLIKHGPNGSLVVEPQERFPQIQAFTHNVATGDFNGDGHIDVFMCNIQGGDVPSPRLLINNGAGSFTSTSQGLPEIVKSFTRKYMASAAADLDGDGDIDLVLGGHDGAGFNENFAHDAILWNDGNGNFTMAPDNTLPPRALGAAGGTVAISIGDLNGDGLPDLVMSTLFEYREPRIQLLLANGDGTWRDASERIPQQWPIGPTYGSSWIRWVFLEDLNADGLKDLVVVGQNETPSSVYLNTGNAWFIPADPFIRLGSGIQSVAVADVDGDGRPDLVSISNGTTLTVQRHLSNLTVPTSIEHSDASDRPSRLELTSWPNPFNPNTVIGFRLSVFGKTTLTVYDLLGREVAVLVDTVMPAGQHSAHFDARGLPSGVYLVRLESANEILTRKVTLLK
jgi:hypothetical protein